jgi:hypothetical protein
VLIALDGTEYHRSTKIQCPHCSTRTRKASRPSLSTPCSAPRSWLRAVPRWCRSSRVHQAARRSRQAGLREPRRAALARSGTAPATNG